MDNSAYPVSAETIAAAFEWWRDAGVDGDLAEDATNWLAVPATHEGMPATLSSPSEAAPAKVTRREPMPTPSAAPIDLSAMPADLAAFHDWWMTEPSLDAGRTQGRVRPRGKGGAALMVLVAQPEAEDNECLLSGIQGRLLDGFVRAAGLSAEDLYIASALPRHTPHADWTGLAAQGLGSVIAHHVVLAAPRRLIVFGGIILPLFGNSLPNSADTSRQFNHEGHTTPVLVARGLDNLLDRQSWKAAFWRDWLGWAR